MRSAPAARRPETPYNRLAAGQLEIQYVLLQHEKKLFGGRPADGVGLIDMQQAAGLELNANASQVGNRGDARSAGLNERAEHLIREDPGKTGLSQAAAGGLEDVGQRLAALYRGTDCDSGLLFRGFLADHLVEGLRSQGLGHQQSPLWTWAASGLKRSLSQGGRADRCRRSGEQVT